jgi:hypothetical protein
MKKYLLYTATDETEKNGGPKMVLDMVQTALKADYEPIAFYKVKGLNTTVRNLFSGMAVILQLSIKLRKGDLVLIQFPMNRELMSILYSILKLKKVHIVTMIHDVDYLRNIPLRNKGVEGMKEFELRLLNKTEYLICPNQVMIDRLKEDGVSAKFIPQEVSDYMYEGQGAKKVQDNTIVIAGNLLNAKAGYIYKLQEQKFRLALYGSNLDDSFSYTNAAYQGAYPPSELIDHMQGDFGLVWDGPDTDKCGGDYGNYQKYNNPHKLSLYLAAGLPVIVWREAALSRFVEKERVGFVVDTLDEIDEQLTVHVADEFAENVLRVGSKIREGGYLRTSLDRIEQDIQMSKG